MLLMVAGSALVFRSAPGLGIALLLVLPLAVRIKAEEAFLRREFGEEYTAYEQRTWRLVPFVY
jgi:protein-S-isoprenylcysteine O-methyltransferase Ste14